MYISTSSVSSISFSSCLLPFYHDSFSTLIFWMYRIYMLRRLIREIGVFGECLCSLHLTLLIHLSPKSERHERLTAHTNTIASIQIILSIVSENHVNALMFNKNHLTISLTHRKIELLGFFICASQID